MSVFERLQAPTASSERKAKAAIARRREHAKLQLADAQNRPRAAMRRDVFVYDPIIERRASSKKAGNSGSRSASSSRRGSLKRPLAGATSAPETPITGHSKAQQRGATPRDHQQAVTGPKRASPSKTDEDISPARPAPMERRLTAESLDLLDPMSLEERIRSLSTEAFDITGLLPADAVHSSEVAESIDSGTMAAPSRISTTMTSVSQRGRRHLPVRLPHANDPTLNAHASAHSPPSSRAIQHTTTGAGNRPGHSPQSQKSPQAPSPRTPSKGTAFTPTARARATAAASPVAGKNSTAAARSPRQGGSAGASPRPRSAPNGRSPGSRSTRLDEASVPSVIYEAPTPSPPPASPGPISRRSSGRSTPARSPATPNAVSTGVGVASRSRRTPPPKSLGGSTRRKAGAATSSVRSTTAKPILRRLDRMLLVRDLDLTLSVGRCSPLLDVCARRLECVRGVQRAADNLRSLGLQISEQDINELAGYRKPRAEVVHILTAFVALLDPAEDWHNLTVEWDLVKARIKARKQAMAETAVGGLPAMVTVVEVHRDNATKLLPRLMLALSRASFVALDLEMTGLGDRRQARAKDMNTKYGVYCQAARSRALLSMGLAVFSESHPQAESSENAVVHYQVQVFELLLSSLREYVVEPLSLQFLLRHGFDFNRQVRDGLTYTPGAGATEAEAPPASKRAKAGSASGSGPGPGPRSDSAASRALIRKEVPRRVFEALIQSTAPIVTHNGLLDLCFLYQHLWADLPATLDVFVADCSQLFGRVIDTKYVAEYEAREPASFLEYLFRTAFRRVQRGVGMALQQPAYTMHLPASYRGEYAMPALQSRWPLTEASRLCRHYERFGHCNRGEACPNLHDLDLVLDVQEARTRKPRQTPSGDQPSSVPLTVAPSGAAGNTVHGHRAGFDAFMTGFYFASWAAGVTSEKQSSVERQIYVMGRDRPLLLTKSQFTNYSAGHTARWAQLHPDSQSGAEQS
ncbi:uncharacterized protein MONBRDRAFT_9179 [Monosiga brevicollis MX1]|uniref:C3H1-type domain-containing protein n=1 Tax=Monosiga brevicollis TaxID=81824 RepID=A9V2B8_MONBE|nr:uncharacterized protein MONBRDRAFT_9179 [Monosiga brevicollis MX1]EDQ88348.1 predicted protein [Monosiga brevicollis MX1]|eukprot:XP_001746941.1 hypothetical protein [Monosiga brevicollis MX1]